MIDPVTRFAPTYTAALERLAAFLPRAGQDYARRRNYDLGRDEHVSVSTLSPYLRCRLITEEDVLRAVLGRFSASSADKFIQEVLWRTYWKGWLQLRPSVWTAYRSDLKRALDQVHSQSGLRQRWEDACLGQTGIACFDAWAKELTETGYLHNHARMWFASIWIFTLELPWTLGADFFLRHLLDGDPASNTLSWRWVAGLQTRGKTYLARSSNIAKYTEGRFDPGSGLSPIAVPLDGPPAPPLTPLPPADPLPESGRVGLILHDDDLSPKYLFEHRLSPAGTAVISTRAALSPLCVAPHVACFSRGKIRKFCLQPFRSWF